MSPKNAYPPSLGRGRVEPVPPTRPRLRARYDRRQQAVIDAAAQLFAEQGYHATSMADLAEATDLTAGGLYHYFAGKDALLAMVVRQLIEPLTAEATRIAAGSEPAEERLRAVVHAWVRHVETHPHHMKVFIRERLTSEDGLSWGDARSARKAFEDVVDGLLAEVEKERGAAFADRGVVLHALLGMVNWTAQWFAPDGRATLDDVADAFTDLVLGKPALGPAVRR